MFTKVSSDDVNSYEGESNWEKESQQESNETTIRYIQCIVISSKVHAAWDGDHLKTVQTLNTYKAILWVRIHCVDGSGVGSEFDLRKWARGYELLVWIRQKKRG